MEVLNGVQTNWSREKVPEPDQKQLELNFIEGNIVHHQADGLISTGNVFLNMSGGVNGELLSKGGTNLQRELHDWLNTQGQRYVQPGFVKAVGPEPFDFRCIVYVVAVDGFYNSSIELIKLCLQRAFSILTRHECKSIAIPALATGYGRLSRETFGTALKEFIEETGDWGLQRIDVVCERKVELVQQGYAKTRPN